MKTQKEILAKIKEVRNDDFFGVKTTDLVFSLPYKVAKKFLNKETTEEEFNRDNHLTDEKVVKEIKKYLPFAWDKANNRRGLSAARSLEHFSIWLWLIGEDALAEEIQTYEYYGKPQLVAISEKFKVNWKKLDDGSWGNNESQNITAAQYYTSKTLMSKPLMLKTKKK